MIIPGPLLRRAALIVPSVMLAIAFSPAPRTVSGGTPAKAAGTWFTDVAPRSSFAYITHNDYTGRKYFPQPMCGGVAIFDYDNDGKMDIFFTNGAKLPGD